MQIKNLEKGTQNLKVLSKKCLAMFLNKTNDNEEKLLTLVIFRG